MRHIYTSLDIGTDTIKVTVCELCGNKLNLLGASSVKAKGIKRGVIANHSEAISSIKKAIQEVEQMLGIKVDKVLVTLPSYFAEYKAFDESIKNDGTPITGEHIKKLSQQIIEKNTVKKNEIAAVQIYNYLVNGNPIKDPKGLSTDLIEAQGIYTSIPKENLYSVVALLEQNGINVIDVNVGPIADYYAYRTKEYDSKKGIVVNIGFETTIVSVVNQGITIKSTILQNGGKNIDNDIAYIYKIDNATAVNLKEKYAYAHPSGAQKEDAVVVKNIVNEEIEITQKEITDICVARLKEILKSIEKEISSLTNTKNDYIIITGGVSNMKGLGKLASEILGQSTVIEGIKLLGVRNNKFSTAIGTIIFFINKIKIRGQDYSMISEEAVENMLLKNKNRNMLDGSVLDKLFNYFFN